MRGAGSKTAKPPCCHSPPDGQEMKLMGEVALSSFNQDGVSSDSVDDFSVAMQLYRTATGHHLAPPPPLAPDQGGIGRERPASPLEYRAGVRGSGVNGEGRRGQDGPQEIKDHKST
jgi:hypothetical protein